MVPAQTGFLSPAGSTTFTVAVDIPPGTPAATVHTVAIEAFAVLDPTARDVLTDTTTVQAAYGLALAPDNSSTVPDGTTAVYQHTLTNIGNIVDTVSLAVTGVPPSWSVTLAPPTVPNLAPAATATVIVTVTVPPNTGGQTHVATVTATSSNPLVTATAVNTTTVQQQQGVIIAPTATRSQTRATRWPLACRHQSGQRARYLHPQRKQYPRLAQQPGAADSDPGGRCLSRHHSHRDGAASGCTWGRRQRHDHGHLQHRSDSRRHGHGYHACAEQPGVAFTPSNTSTVNAGTVVAYMHTLTNTGDGPDQYDIAASSSNGWLVATPPRIALAPGATTQVAVTLTVPAGPGGVTDIMQVSATSVISPAVFAAVTNTTIVSTTSSALGVTIAPDNSGTGLPGDTVVYGHFITNTGSIASDFTIAAVSDQGWATTVVPNTIFLQPGGVTSIIVSVSIPAGATHNTVDMTTVTVTDLSATVSDVAVDTTTVDVSGVLGVQVEPNGFASGLPGDTVTFAHWLTNTGTVADIYDLTAVSGNGWIATVTPAIVSLPAGSAAPVTVTVAIPGASSNGSLDTTTITARSQAVPAIEDTAEDITLVRLPANGVLIAPDSVQTGLPGDTVTYQHTLTNTSTATHTFLINTQTSHAWPVVVMPVRIDNVAPGESHAVTVTVTIPGATANGAENFTAVVATAFGDPSVTDMAFDHTGCRSPWVCRSHQTTTAAVWPAIWSPINIP